jgi:hypothetical protein
MQGIHDRHQADGNGQELCAEAAQTSWRRCELSDGEEVTTEWRTADAAPVVTVVDEAQRPACWRTISVEALEALDEDSPCFNQVNQGKPTFVKWITEHADAKEQCIKHAQYKWRKCGFADADDVTVSTQWLSDDGTDDVTTSASMQQRPACWLKRSDTCPADPDRANLGEDYFYIEANGGPFENKAMCAQRATDEFVACGLAAGEGVVQTRWLDSNPAFDHVTTVTSNIESCKLIIPSCPERPDLETLNQNDDAFWAFQGHMSTEAACAAEADAVKTACGVADSDTTIKSKYVPAVSVPAVLAEMTVKGVSADDFVANGGLEQVRDAVCATFGVASDKVTVTLADGQAAVEESARRLSASTDSVDVEVTIEEEDVAAADAMALELADEATATATLETALADAGLANSIQLGETGKDSIIKAGDDMFHIAANVAPDCVLNDSGNIVVKYIDDLHLSFHCTKDDESTCSCIDHPTHFGCRSVEMPFPTDGVPVTATRAIEGECP